MEKNKEMSLVDEVNKILKSKDNNQKKSESLINLIKQIKESSQYSIILCLDHDSKKNTYINLKISDRKNDINEQDLYKNTNVRVHNNINIKKKEQDYGMQKRDFKYKGPYQENKIKTEGKYINNPSSINQEIVDIDDKQIKNEIEDEDEDEKTLLNNKINNPKLNVTKDTKFNKKDYPSAFMLSNKNFKSNQVANSICKLPIQKEVYKFHQNNYSNNNYSLANKSLDFISQNRMNNLGFQKDRIGNNNVFNNNQNYQNQQLYLYTGQKNNNFNHYKNY